MLDSQRRSGGPLAGTKVVELSTTLLGPYCGLILAELGADVIKVESPVGDVNRNLLAGRSPGMSPQFLNFNFGKRSLALDLREPSAQRALDAVIAQADVFVHNSRTPTVTKLGFGPARVRAVRPDIVYCSLVGFSDASAMAGHPAYDDVIQAVSGLAALQGTNRGHPEYVVTTICDKVVAWAGAAAICAALAHRERTGVGDDIEVPMFELMAGFALHEQLGGWTFEPPLGAIGYPRTLSSLRRPYRAKDGYISVALITSAQWTAFFELAGIPEVLTEARFATPGGRTANIGELLEIVEGALAHRTVLEWVELLEAAAIPAAPTRSLEDVALDPYLNGIGVVEAVEHASEGSLRRVRQPISFAAWSRPDLGDAPALGEHTGEILRQVGVTDADIAELVDDGAPLGAMTPQQVAP